MTMSNHVKSIMSLFEAEGLVLCLLPGCWTEPKSASPALVTEPPATNCQTRRVADSTRAYEESDFKDREWCKIVVVRSGCLVRYASMPMCSCFPLCDKEEHLQ